MLNRGASDISLLVLASTDLEDIEAKGTKSMLEDFDEDGFFKRVTLVFPWARRSEERWISAKVRVVSLGRDRAPLSSSYRSVRIFLAPLFILAGAYSTRKLIKQDSPSVVRSTDPFWTALVGWMATRFTGVPFVISLHADWDKRRELTDSIGVHQILGSWKLTRALSGWLLRRSDYVLAVRESLAELAIRSGVAPSRVLRFPHVIDDELFAPVTDDAYSTDTRYLFFAGRLSRENYVYDLLEMAMKMPADAEGEIWLAGMGPEQIKLEEMVTAHRDLKSRVRFLGALPREEVMKLRRQAVANVCLMGGYSLIEASASGRPVIAYDVEWHSELIQDGVSGFLVPEGNVDQLTSAALRCLCSESECSEVGARGRQRAWELHSKSEQLSSRWNAYKAMLGGQ